jgi:O-antigen/teichoic acid export membrane protein
MTGPVARRSVAVNTAWSLSGRLWQAMLQLFVTPITIRLLGPEQYGVAAFGGTLLASLMAFDWAVSPVLLRELSRRTDAPDWPAYIRTLLATLQWISLSIALLLGGLVIAGAPWLAGNWLIASTLDHATLTAAVMLSGAGITAQWPGFLYGGGFAAIERHDRVVIIFVVGVTVQMLGAVALLWLVSPSVVLFLGWLAATYAMITAMQGVSLWRAMPRSAARTRASFAVLRPHLRFARGNFALGWLTMALTQSDKLIVARSVALDQFAAYSLAAFAASTVVSFTAAPVSASSHPRMTDRALAGDQAGVAFTLHRMAQQMAAVLVPTAAGLAAFATPVLSAWLGRGSPLVAPVAGLLPWMLAGVVLNTLVSVPYLMLNAHGRTRLTVMVNLVAVPPFIAACWFGMQRFGAIAGPVSFIVLNLAYIAVFAPLAFRTCLPGHYAPWLLREVLLPAAAGVATTLTVRALLPASESLAAQLAGAALAGAVALAVTALLLPHARDTLATLARRIRRRVA